jgi:hypothetical protein
MIVFKRIPVDLAPGNHRAFGPSGGAGRVQQHSDIVFVGGIRFQGRLVVSRAFQFVGIQRQQWSGTSPDCWIASAVSSKALSKTSKSGWLSASNSRIPAVGKRKFSGTSTAPIFAQAKKSSKYSTRFFDRQATRAWGCKRKSPTEENLPSKLRTRIQLNIAVVLAAHIVDDRHAVGCVKAAAAQPFVEEHEQSSFVNYGCEKIPNDHVDPRVRKRH